MLFIFLSPHFCSAFCRSLLRGWDFHMVCCCIKSNLTLLDQRLWGSGVCALCASSPPILLLLFLFWGRSWIPKIGLFICLHTKMSSFFNKNLWVALESCFIRIASYVRPNWPFMVLNVIMSFSIWSNNRKTFESIFTFNFHPAKRSDVIKRVVFHVHVWQTTLPTTFAIK